MLFFNAAGQLLQDKRLTALRATKRSSATCFVWHDFPCLLHVLLDLQHRPPNDCRKHGRHEPLQTPPALRRLRQLLAPVSLPECTRSRGCSCRPAGFRVRIAASTTADLGWRPKPTVCSPASSKREHAGAKISWFRTSAKVANASFDASSCVSGSCSVQYTLRALSLCEFKKRRSAFLLRSRYSSSALNRKSNGQASYTKNLGAA